MPVACRAIVVLSVEEVFILSHRHERLQETHQHAVSSRFLVPHTRGSNMCVSTWHALHVSRHDSACHCILEHISEQGLSLCTSNSAVHAVNRNLCGSADVVSSQDCRWRPEYCGLRKCHLWMSTTELAVRIDRLKTSSRQAQKRES